MEVPLIRVERLRRIVPVLAAALASCGSGEGAGAADPGSLPEARAGVVAAGVLEPPAGEGFWEPADIVVEEGAAMSGVWIVDRKAARVYRYDLTGRYRGALARQGSGPGELEGPLALGIVGDTLWVYNAGNRRIDYLAADGTSLGTLPLPETAGTVLDLIDVGANFVASTVFGPAPLLRFSREGAVAEAQPFGERLAEFESRYRAASGDRSAAGADAIPSLYRLAEIDGRVWALHLYLPILGIFEPGGELVRIVTYPSEPVEAGGEKVEEIDGVRRRLRAAPPSPGGAIGIMEDGRGDLLLLTHQADRGRQRFYRLNVAGDVLARIESPFDGWLAVGAWSGDRRYALAVVGELEEPAVVRLVPE